MKLGVSLNSDGKQWQSQHHMILVQQVTQLIPLALGSVALCIKSLVRSRYLIGFRRDSNVIVGFTQSNEKSNVSTHSFRTHVYCQPLPWTPTFEGTYPLHFNSLSSWTFYPFFVLPILNYGACGHRRPIFTMQITCGPSLWTAVSLISTLFANPATASRGEAQHEREYFYVGGNYITTPAGSLFQNQMYVEKLTPPRVSQAYPIVFLHGGAQTGTVSTTLSQQAVIYPSYLEPRTTS